MTRMIPTVTIIKNHHTMTLGGNLFVVYIQFERVPRFRDEEPGVHLKELWEITQTPD